MARQIKRVAVLGSGVMGSGIAAHLAGVGLKTLLLDIVPREPNEEEKKKGLSIADKAVRNRLANAAVQAAAKMKKPPVFYNSDDAELIEVGNFEDDLAKIAECDWVVEAIVENLEIKRQLFAKVDELRRPGTIVTSNTSGIKIRDMVQGRSGDFVRHFFVTHFFNPVRFMRLLELVRGKDTDPQVFAAMAKFGADRLGKGIVFGKDTPNFVANRIGTYAMMHTLHSMVRDGTTIEEVDAVFGPATGRAKSAVFRTADIVGLDTLAHVAKNCHESLVDDECRETFKAPEFLGEMLKRGWLGQKTKGGFYKKDGKEILALDLKSFEYKPKQKFKADSIGAARGIEDVGKRIATLIEGDDSSAKLAWDSLAHTLTYSARRIGEIADDVVNIDNAMKWGFNWELGPFETWDAIGLAESVERMKKDGIKVPQWVTEMLESGKTSFYAGTSSTPTYYDVRKKDYQDIPQDARHIRLPALREQNKIVKNNAGATLFDIGDGVLLLEFHTKMNAVDDQVIGMLHQSVDLAEEQGYNGLVIGNEHKDAFSAGANLFAVLMAINQKQWKALEEMISSFQQANLRLRYSDIPVVVAPAGLALGGGAEMAMAGDATRAFAELYMGLVEVGVGVLPAAGGNLEMLERFCGNLPDDPTFDPFPFIRRAFENVALAKVSIGAEDARMLGMLRPNDSISLNRDLLFYDAKQMVLGMARAGYRRPRPMKFRLPGPSGAATFASFVNTMVESGWATEHDAKIAKKVAWVLCGGETTTRIKVSQQHILDLEREAFLSLCGERKSQDRMQHMLMKNKPLRN
ncbi:MAG: 3-hydroxyacyl-CoA dehydrogenase/enoyl-CoA hydratase family protein [Pseudomonadota bacterium]